MKYFRQDKLPHIWCPGCGHGITMGAVVRAIDKVGLDQEKTTVVSGIGCSSRAPGYMKFDTLHTTHGRALAFATGVKHAKPDLNVLVMTGDGDATAIGGNHLIHACRRNIDITTVLFNNSIYGMTGGQYSPLTPTGAYASTAPYGNIDQAFDICKVAEAAGATYVARGTVYHTVQLIDLIKKGIENKGFSLIEVVTPCPTVFGRRNKRGSAVDMMKWLQANSVNVKRAEKMTKEELQGKIITGELYHEERPEYTEEYAKIIRRVQKEESHE